MFRSKDELLVSLSICIVTGCVVISEDDERAIDFNGFVVLVVKVDSRGESARGRFAKLRVDGVRPCHKHLYWFVQFLFFWKSKAPRKIRIVIL